MDMVITICGFILTISVNVALVARWSGKTSAQISAMQADILRLEKKQDESNKVKERLARCEEMSKSAHHRIDELVS